jgi:hypothetical protein
MDVTYLFCYGHAIVDFADVGKYYILVMLQKMASYTNNHRYNGTYLRTMAQDNNHK